MGEEFVEYFLKVRMKLVYLKYTRSINFICTLIITIILSACGAKQEQEVNTVGSAKPILQQGTTVIFSSPIIFEITSKPNTVNVVPASPIIKTPTITVSNTQDTNWVYDWLNDKPCTIPCWEGITPGITSYSEAMKIIEKLPFTTKIEDDTPTTPRIRWKWLGFEDVFSSASIFYDDSNAQKKIITINLSFPEGFKVKAVLTKYGEPDYVWNEKSTIDGKSTTYSTALIYLNKGFTITYQTNKASVFNDDTLFTDILFTTPGSLEEYQKKIHYPYSLASLPRWQGYKDFNFYWSYGR